MQFPLSTFWRNNWLNKIATNEGFLVAYFYTINKVINEEEKLYQSSAPILIALALLYKQTQDSRLDAILNALKLVPNKYIPKEVKDVLEIWDKPGYLAAPIMANCNTYFKRFLKHQGSGIHAKGFFIGMYPYLISKV